MLNFEQQAAFDAIVKGSGNVLLTGNAGTGKSFVLKQAIQALQAQDQGVMVCATTGVASTLIGGKTVHSALGINPFGNVKSNFSSMMSKFENISQTDIIVIDEVSMMSPDLLDQIDHIFRKMFEHHKPFGGMRFVFVGDFLQLPPVEKNGPPKFVFESEAWANAQVQVMQLVTVVRQQDETFANFLANIRQAVSTPSTLDVIKSRMGLIPDKPVTRFVPTNAEADEINISSLAALEGESKVFVANDKNPNKYNPSSSSWVEDTEYWDKNCLAPKRLELKVGARVICLKNSSNVLSLGLVNGDTGTVTRLGSDQITVSWDRFYGEEEAVTVTKFAQDDGSNWKTTKGFREQFPLKLAYAITIHKSQGMTIPSARIALGKAFAEGQIYVALSRVQTLEGLYIDSYSPQALKASVKALKFYNLPGNVTGQEAIAISYMDEIAQQPKEAIMKEVINNTGKVYAGSGSRSLREDPMMFDKVVMRLIEMIEMSKPAMLITGMAEGFDEALAIAAIATNTPLKAMVPFKGYCNHYWGVKSVTGRNRLAECKEILAYAQSTGGVEYICSDWNGPDGRSAMIHRNEAMANACDKAWIYNPVTPGTKRFKEYCDANKVWYYIIKIDGEGPGDTPQTPTPQGPKEDNMKTYIITYTDGTKEVVVTDKRISELAEELKAAGKGGSIKPYKEEEVVETPQIETVQTSVQEVIEPKEQNMINIYHWLEQSDIVDKLGRHIVSGQKDAEMVMVITNNPTPDRKQAFQSALMGTGSATYGQVAGNDLWLAPINSGTWGFHYLERLNQKGIKFTIAIRRMDLMKEFWDENPKTVTQVGEHLVNLANLSWADQKNLYLLDIDGVPAGGQFNWDLIGIEANDAKKLTKRMAEIVRLSKSASSDNLRVLALSPENNTSDPGFWVKAYDGKNAIRFSALPKDMRESMKKKGHLHLMGRGLTKVDINGVMTKVLVKGDFVVVPDYMWTWKDVDVVAHIENLKTEVTLKDPAEDDLWTFWEHAPLHVTTWDQQTMLNYPQLLTVARMREDYLAEMNGIDAQLAKGLLPGQVEDNHQIQGEEEAHDEFKKLLPKAEEIRKNRDLATKIRDAGFDIRMFENLIGFAVRGYAESKARFKHVPEFDMNGNPGALNDKHDKHVVVMRNSFRATCVTDAFLNEFVGIPYPAKRIAFFDSTVGMVWNAEHFARTFELHGTHDNDDTHYFVPIKVWSSDKKTVPTLKKHGVILPGMQVPSTAQNAKMVLLVLRLPNGAGEYSIMEFDFATWPKEISFDESLVETHDLSFSSGWVSPQPMVMPGNMPGLPTSRVYSKTSYTKADLMTDMDAQFVNPGFGTMCNALVSYSSITGGGIPACMTDSLGNIVDATQQGADIASFQAIELLLADIKSELVAMGRNSHLEMNEYFYLRRGAVAKKATKAGVMSVRKGEIETFDTEYTKVYSNLKNNVKYKYSFQMRSQVPINQRISNMQFTKAELDWCKDFVLEIEKNITEADKAPTGVVVTKFTKPLHQAILRERRQVIVDAAIAKMESMKDVNKAMLCLWHTILKPDFISKDAKYGYMDRVICQMGSERALAHLLIEAIIDMENKRKFNIGATKIVLTNNKMVNGAFVNHVVKPLQADRATQIPVDIISDIIGKIPQGFNFVWVMAEDKPLAVFKRQNSTFVEIIVDLPQTIKV